MDTPELPLPEPTRRSPEQSGFVSRLITRIKTSVRGKKAAEQAPELLDQSQALEDYLERGEIVRVWDIGMGFGYASSVRYENGTLAIYKSKEGERDYPEANLIAGSYYKKEQLI